MTHSNFIHTRVHNHIGFITLDRPRALNSLSLEMIRAITHALLEWRDSHQIRAIFIHGNHEQAFCAGGDIRFFYDAAKGASIAKSALVDDFFTEEYKLNYLIHHYPKPYISLLNGVVMGGGMGIGQGGQDNQLRIVTERTKMAMPEVNIGLFPDVGGSYFLSRCAGELGTYLGLTGETIHAADAIYTNLADIYLPYEHIPALITLLEQTGETDLHACVRNFVQPFQTQLSQSQLAQNRVAIDHFFLHNQVTDIYSALKADASPLARQTYNVMQTRSPIMMCVTLEQLRRGKSLSMANCLRMERIMIRRAFNYGEVLEGVRALVIDKDKQPKWQPASLSDVTPEMISQFFEPVWPDYAHPLRDLE